MFFSEYHSLSSFYVFVLDVQLVSKFSGHFQLIIFRSNSFERARSTVWLYTREHDHADH